MLGEAYTPEDEEDSAVATVGSVWVYQARYRVPVARATAGNLVLIEGVDATITRTATLVSDAYDEPVHIFRWVGLRVGGAWGGGGGACRVHARRGLGLLRHGTLLGHWLRRGLAAARATATRHAVPTQLCQANTPAP